MRKKLSPIAKARLRRERLMQERLEREKTAAVETDTQDDHASLEYGYIVTTEEGPQCRGDTDNEVAQTIARKPDAELTPKTTPARTISDYSFLGEDSATPGPLSPRPQSPHLVFPSPRSVAPSLSLPNSLGRPHEKYFFDEDVVVKVEDTLYKIPTTILERSPYFRSLLEKSSLARMSNPLCVTGATRVEMDCLLRLLLRRMLDEDTLDFDIDQLFIVLRLSTLWQFEAAQNWAIKEIEKVEQDPIKRLGLGYKWKVLNWLEPAFVMLCMQPTDWTSDQVKNLYEELGADKLAALIGIRGRRDNHKSDCDSGITADPRVEGVRREIHISEALGLPLDKYVITDG